MKVVFNGLMETKSGGCSSCGKRKKTEQGFTTTKHYFLPSGREETFYMGRPVEVSDTDGAFLLSYETTDKNGTRKVFSRVD